jgi:uncharacterized protein (UPF0248 family)
MSLQKLHDEWSLANVDTHMKTIIGKEAKKQFKKQKPVKIKNIDREFDDIEGADSARIFRNEDRRLKRWLKANEPEDGELYYISVPSYGNDEDGPREEMIGRYLKFDMSYGNHCFIVLGSSDSIPWHRKVKILGKVIRRK